MSYVDHNPPFRRVLIANRGEIAVRVARACRSMGIEVVAVHSDADADAQHVRIADRAMSLGGTTPRESYLVAERVLEAAVASGADAIHPGYGFLSENAAFAALVEQAGIVFVGPRPETIEAMGSKTGARAIMEAASVPVVPGYQGDDVSPERLATEAARIGYPVLVKAVYGGGGKGMRVVTEPAELLPAVAAATREAQGAFGNGAVFLEKFLVAPRHIEVQVLGDGEGNAIHLFERECSLQRRHQKIVEEAPSPSISAELRAHVCEAGRRAAMAVRYRGAGTVEFIVGADGSFYFLEMNTRLQVEHPVTELICGVDLVRAQLEVAAGRGLPWQQGEVQARGHAIECRIYAEDPASGFLPSVGKLLRFDAPVGPGIRFDSGFRAGDVITPHYDPMLAKLCAYGATRREATERMLAALADCVVQGVRSNVGFLAELLATDAFESAAFHTRWVDETYAQWQAPSHDAAWLAAALGELEAQPAGAGAAAPPEAPNRDPFLLLRGFAMGGHR